MKFLFVILFFIFVCLTTYRVAADADIKDMCPSIPEEIEALRPKRDDYVIITEEMKEAFKLRELGINTAFTLEQMEKHLEQVDKHRAEEEAFEALFSKEFKKVEDAWRGLDKNLFASQKRFYYLLPENIENNDLLDEVRSFCWQKVMGIDELGKLTHCHPLEKPPSRNEWNEMLVCTMDRASTLKMKLNYVLE